MRALFYGVTDPDDLAWMADRLTWPPVEVLRAEARAHQRGRALGDPAVPHRLHVDDRPPAIRQLMEEARADGRLWDIDTGHDLMITEPQAVADALVQVAAA